METVMQFLSHNAPNPLTLILMIVSPYFAWQGFKYNRKRDQQQDQLRIASDLREEEQKKTSEAEQNRRRLKFEIHKYIALRSVVEGFENGDSILAAFDLKMEREKQILEITDSL